MRSLQSLSVAERRVATKELQGRIIDLLTRSDHGARLDDIIQTVSKDAAAEPSDVNFALFRLLGDQWDVDEGVVNRAT